jgi:cytochrome c oxidase subunit 4
MASRTKQAQPRSRRSGYLTGLVVGLILAVLTAVEYWIGSNPDPSPVFLLLISALKSVFVVYFFMHVYRLWRTEGSH